MDKIDISVLDGLIVGRVEPHIYAFSTQTVPNYTKVGDTYRPVDTRLKEWTVYFPDLKKLFSDVAKVDDEIFFRDYSVHSFLESTGKLRLARNTFSDLPYFSNEFFADTSVADVQEAIADIKASHTRNDGRYQFYQFKDSPIPLDFHWDRVADFAPRDNQEQVIKNFQAAYAEGRTNLLMYAVMRFGKSFTAMCCATAMKAKFVVIVSAKADVRSEWKRTVESHKRFEGFVFLDSEALARNSDVITQTLSADSKVALFLTLQDLQGNDVKVKHRDVFANQIDLLLVDESHFGARGNEYGKVLQDAGIKTKSLQKAEMKGDDATLEMMEETTKSLRAKVRIHLSGTPYRILMGSEFTKEDIIAFCQFTDIIAAQEQWNTEHLNEDDVKEWDNPYYGFPQMLRFAFNPNASSVRRLQELKQQGATYAFSALFKPLSITKDAVNHSHQEFVYEQEIFDLLSAIDGTTHDENLLSFLDYDRLKEGNMCRHIVCVLPFRASCDAMECLIKAHASEFKNLGAYEIINIAGVEDERTYHDTNAVKAKIDQCEKSDRKTLTLTVNRMLTGSTVEQWDTMLYFKDTASPQEYDQAIFRLQNQYVRSFKNEEGDEIRYNMKPQTLLVDFDPLRLFRMQEQKSQIYNVNTEHNGNDLLELRIARELAVSPVIMLDSNLGKLRETLPADIMQAVSDYSHNKSVADEALEIPVDYALLRDETIKSEIEQQSEMSGKGGFEIEPQQGEDDITVPDALPRDDNTPPQQEPDNTPAHTDETESLRKKFATYYSRLLFYAFLTQTEVRSLQHIIDSMDSDGNNQRIARSLHLNCNVLMLFKQKMNPFALSKLDYKIANINNLANDASLPPLERAQTAMRKFERLSQSEIITPSKVADDMVAIIPADGVADNASILDIAAKQGEFAVALYKRFGDAVRSNIYSAITSPIAYEFTRKVYEILGMPIDHIFSNFTSYDMIGDHNTEIINQLDKMKFKVIVGNPPYQENDGSGASNDAAMPIYNKYVAVAKTLLPQYSVLIMPAKWMVGGRGLKGFRAEMMQDRHIRLMYDYEDSAACFPNQHIDGGICYFLWSKEYNGTTHYVYNLANGNTIQSDRFLQDDKSEIVVRDGRRLSIISKTTSKNKFSNIVSYTQPFGVRKDLFNNIEKYKNVKISDNVFTHSAYIWGVKGIKGGARRTACYIERDIVTKNAEWVDKYKLFFTTSYSTNAVNPPEIIIADKGVICTETFLVIGVFDLQSTRDHCYKYMQTKFFKLLLHFGKGTMQVSKNVFNFIPLQDFTDNSDIDWGKSIAEIDKQLYAKYGLTSEEVAFIESTIKPME